MYICGVDVGTTGTKAIVANEAGAIVGRAYREYPLITLADGGIEQRAEDWWDTLCHTVREATQSLPDKAAVRAICLSTQAGSAVLTDEKGAPLANAHTWMDTRPAAMAPRVAGPEGVYLKSGWKLNGALMLLRALWLQEHMPAEWAAAAKYLTTVDYLNHKMTGRFVMDQTNAGMTQLVNVREKRWDADLLVMAGVPEGMLAGLQPAGEPLGGLLPEAAESMGLAAGTLVVNGGHDQYCAAVGAGALEAGEMLLSTGTAWVLLCVTAQPAFDTEDYLSVGSHIAAGRYGLLSSVPTGGVGLEWVRNQFAPMAQGPSGLAREGFKAIDAEAKKRVLQDKNLYFYPQFTGRAFPRWTPDSKATWLGVGLEHDAYDLALAVMEGVVFDTAVSMEAYAAKGYAPTALKLMGGASKSALWTSIISDVTGLPVARYTEADMACLGALAMAGVACGMFASLAEGAGRLGQSGCELLPPGGGETRRHYREKYARYKEMLPTLENLYKNYANHTPEGNHATV